MVVDRSGARTRADIDPCQQVAPILVDLPADANADTCRGFRDVRYVDINGDGKLDIAASMNVKSNAFDGYVDEPVVYYPVAIDRVYGRPYGPTYEWLLAKPGSPQGVIAAGMRSNATMDILTGIAKVGP